MSETSTAPGGRRGIGSALALLLLLVCCGLASPAPALTRRTRWAAGILVASLALLTPAPAKAQTTVWSATLTVDKAGVFFGCDNQDANQDNCSTALTDDDFTLGGTAYHITQLYFASSTGVLFFNLDRAIPDAIKTTARLRLDSTNLNFSAATYPTGVRATWRNLSLSWSDNDTVSVSLTIPATGLSLDASAITLSGATLTLSGHGAAWWYKRTSPNNGGCIARSSSQTTADLSGLAPNTWYTYRAYSNSFCTRQIASVRFRTQALDAPTNLRAEAGNGQVTLSWDTVTGARGYRYKVWEGTGENERAVTNWVWFSGSYGDTSSGVVSGLTNGTTYTFRVQAMARGWVTHVYQGGVVVRREQWVSGPESGPEIATPVGSSPGACGGRLSGDGSVTGRWVTGGQGSTARGRRYACWYEFSLAERQRVSISLRSGEADPYLYLRSGARRSGTAIVSNDDGGPGRNSRIVQALDPGTYTIEATTFGQAETGGFTLTLSSQAEQEEAPSTSQCTQQLTGDGAVTGRWTAGCDSIARAGRHARWYEFTLAERRDVVINLQSGSADSYLYLRSDAGERLGRAMASDDDGGQGYNSRIVRTLDAGTYTIEATTYGGGETGRFTLTLSGTGETATRPPEETGPDDEPTTSEPPPASEPELRIFDARANEGSPYNSGEMNFRVTLAPAQSGSVGVCYQTRDGTAQGDLYGRYGDYEEAYGCMYFAAGETSKYISVRLIGDWHDEGDETFFMVLEDARGAIIADGEATGIIVNSGPIPKAWTTRFARTVADQVLDAVEGRMGSEAMRGLEVNLAGQRLGWPASGESGHAVQHTGRNKGEAQPDAQPQPVAQARQVEGRLAQWLVVGSGESGDAALRTVNGDDLLANSSFALASPVSNGGLLSFWGRGAITSFDGREGELSLDGQVRTVMLGTDWSWGQWSDGGQARRSTAGLLLSHSRGDGGYAGSEDGGDVDATLTGVFPWVGHRFSHQLEAWGAAGYGQGELQVTPKPKDKDGATLTADLNLWLAAGGLRGTLLDGGNEGLTLTGKGDAMVVGTSSGQVTGANDNLAASQATVTRLRLGLEAHRPFPLGNPDSGTGTGSGATLTPSLEVGLRHDGGDAETGFGLDLGGGIVLSHPERGLQAELRGRGLLSHAAEGFRDRGFSGSLSWQQQPDSDRGAALSLSQTMGGLSSGGADALLSRTTLEGLAANNDGSNDDLKNQRLELQLSYGLPAFGDRFTLTPELGLGFYDNGRDYRLGWSLTQPDDGESFVFSFDLTRRESANNNDAPDHGVELRLDTLF